MELVGKRSNGFGKDLDGGGRHGELSLLGALNSASGTDKIADIHELLGKGVALWLSFFQTALLYVQLEASRLDRDSSRRDRQPEWSHSRLRCR